MQTEKILTSTSREPWGEVSATYLFRDVGILTQGFGPQTYIHFIYGSIWDKCADDGG